MYDIKWKVPGAGFRMQAEYYRSSAYMIGGPDVDPMNQKWWCAYVTLSGISKSCHENYSHVSYWDGDEVGVDSDHGWNLGTSLDKRREDARSQIEDTIDEYNIMVTK